MAIDGKASTVDLVSKGQHLAHELTEGATTGNINLRLFQIDGELNSLGDPTKRQQVMAAMDKELTEKGLLPNALQVFAEQKDNHDILKADCRGIHADTLEYNLHPTDPYNATKLKGGHWDADHSPVEMMLTGDMLKNIRQITPVGENLRHSSRDEVTFNRLNDYAKHYGGIAVPPCEGGEPGASPVAPANANADSALKATPANKVTDAKQAKPDSAKELSDEKAAQAKAAQAIKDKDTHTVKSGETLQSIAIAELKAEGKISENASARDLLLSHKQIAFEEHLIRLYTPKLFEHLPNYNGKLQKDWVLNLVPDKEMQQELNASKVKPAPKTGG